MVNLSGNGYALITGGGRGLGYHFSIELAKRGINVLLVSLPGEGLAETCRQISAEYRVKADFMEADLTNKEEILKVCEWVKANYPLGILINNAGFGLSGAFEATPMAAVDSMILINVRATALLTHQLLPLLKANGRGFVLNVSSMAAFSPMGFKATYPATKVFIESFSRGLNEELRGTGVSVSAVHPGPMRTNPEVSKRIANQNFIGRLGALDPEVVARVAIEQMFKEKSSIVIGIGNLVQRALMKLLPSSLVIRMTTLGVRKEIMNAANKVS